MVGQSRVPQGTRGLKYVKHLVQQKHDTSRPARDAWVEILLLQTFLQLSESRVPQGTRGLKFRRAQPPAPGMPVASRKGRVG